jgi:UDP-glucose 6-dehydrogenase
MGLADSLSEATDVANKNHTAFISRYIQQHSVKNAKIGICGISYKTGTQVIEESPGVAIGRKLAAEGHQIRYWDDEETAPSELQDVFYAESSAESLVSSVDFVVITRPLNASKEFYEILETFLGSLASRIKIGSPQRFKESCCIHNLLQQTGNNPQILKQFDT